MYSFTSSSILPAYLGSSLMMGPPYLDDIPPAINSDMLDEAGNSLHPLLPPNVENCFGKMVLRPRPGAECAVSSVVLRVGGSLQFFQILIYLNPLGSLVLPLRLVLLVKLVELEPLLSWWSHLLIHSVSLITILAQVQMT